MLLEVKPRLSGGVAVLELSGTATAGPDAEALRSHLLETFQHTSRYLLLNCENLTYVDSAAVGELVSASASIVKQGGIVKFLRPHKRLLHILTIAKLDRVFEVLDDEAEAIASFTQASARQNQQSMASFLGES